MRQCGDCTLCCKLVPVAELEKPAGVRCQHVRHGKGCSIYEARPASCRAWSCAWRSEADSAELSRPDRSHCIVDPIGMFITINTQGEEPQRVPVVQIWCDPAYPDAYLAPAMLAFIRRRGVNGMATILRYNNTDSLVVVPPELSGKGWVRFHSGKTPLGHLEGCTDRMELRQPVAAAPYYKGPQNA